MKRLSLLTLSLISVFTIQSASAIEPPSRKPNPPYISSVLSRTDTERLRLGLDAASDGDWSRADASSLNLEHDDGLGTQSVRGWNHANQRLIGDVEAAVHRLIRRVARGGHADPAPLLRTATVDAVAAQEIGHALLSNLRG